MHVTSGAVEIRQGTPQNIFAYKTEFITPMRRMINVECFAIQLWVLTHEKSAILNS